MSTAVDNLTDPYLQLSLDGVHLIEASAGTGKTFTLATLFTRLVVEKQLRIGRILAVTFTEAATQELRKRIRQRLQLAARLLGSLEDDHGDAEAQLTRRILRAHVHTSGESRATLQRRLQQAVDEVDLAAIFTIHGFCARVLREHALESGQTFDAPDLLGSERELHEVIAADLWRVYAAEDASLDALTQLWRDPDALAGDLSALLAPQPLLPEAGPVPADPREALAEATLRLSAAIDEALEEAVALLHSAFEQKIFDGRRAKRPSFDKAVATLREGHRAGVWSWDEKQHLHKLLPDSLLGYCKDGHHGKVPHGPVFTALAQLFAAEQDVIQWRRAMAVRLLHTLRGDARNRLLQLKRERRVQSYDDLINGVADALEGPHAEELVQRLRAQYAIALVDEFQDTDDRQWAIFQRVFGDPAGSGERAPALFLIGDPKQAIYGFRGGDVNTYLRAAADAKRAPELDRNFRSRPGVLNAIAQLYGNADASTGGNAFVQPGIAFYRVLPGTTRSDADYQWDGSPAPALRVQVVPANEDGKAFNAEASRRLASDACVAEIHAVLSAAQQGRAQIDGKPLQPGDIAVLVRKHSEATRIQQALARVGIPAVAAGKQSLFASQEAHDLRVLLLALLQPGDEGRLRAALSTVLLGEDASAIAALEHDGERQREHQLQLLQWRERWLKAGPLALVSDLCARHGERLLALLDGERRLSNYLQLSELLQQADARALGLHGVVDWLGQHIAGADPNDEAQLLRLESDAQRVQIVTLHKSKGLEYPLVLLPFVGIGSKPSTPDRRCVVHDGDRRVLHWKLDKDEPRWTAAVQAHAREEAAEDARLLYVGLTRAKQALWVVSGPFYNAASTHLGRMLSDLPALQATGLVDVAHGAVPSRLPLLELDSDGVVAPARRVTRAVPHDWWVYSFTQLAHADAGSDSAAASTEATAGAGDEPVDGAAGGEELAAVAEAAPWDPRFSGSRFGNVLHDALEHTDFSAWRQWRADDVAPAGCADGLRGALRAEGYADDDLEDGVALLTALVGQTLTVGLPEGGCLADLAPFERRAEIEFHFAMQPTAVPALLQLLHAHGVASARNGFGLRRQLEGLMTGKIDLTYTREGRWYVLDYKSNRLPDYSAARLHAAMGHSEYDLQALIYTVALHRWLRFRLGERYDYARDFGGIRYLFCRGLRAGDPSAPGVHAHCYPPQLVDGLDRLFAGGDAGHAGLLQRLGGQA
ncbi:exodeoxyribonuclease V subunit beta [Stenotrophomonas sp. YIM B06876]|uniref:UvrD-helicase domain-containing protein n=1 Tax=Stenotrophomonas sp. YIM B06876 TaxID=3060211 RepID=UPI0027396714|nr:exodeoxyribonuclease V subunit beta [Stenotrophomonas sp. YIM B06876]